MKAFKFITEMFRRFPGLLLINIALSIVVSMLNGCLILAIGPVVDFYMHPDLQGISRFSSAIFSVLEKLHIPISLASLMIIFLCFVLLTTAGTILTRYTILRTKSVFTKKVMLEMYSIFFNARWSFFTKTKQGVLWNAFTQELAYVSDSFSSIASLFAFLVQVIIPIIIPFCISWQVASISLLTAFIFCIPLLFMGKISYRVGQECSKWANLVLSYIQQNIGSAKIVLGFGNHLKSLSKVSQLYDKQLQAILHRQLLNDSMPNLYFPFIALVIITSLFAANIFHVPLSDVAILLLALRQVAISLGNVLSYKNLLDNFYPSYEQIEQLKKEALALPQWTGKKIFTGFQKEILIDNVSFSYLENKPVLKNINIEIKKGQMVALVGRSGAGKSTLTDLILGFYKPDQGKITFDDHDILDFDIISYREKIGYVPQENILFHMTIRENLLWAKENATHEEIAWACQKAHAEEFINNLPHGYDTIVGERGVRLSGGQIQRIALARALLRKPDLLILDEATSSLDSQSERFIQEAIENISEETTVVVIAHRLSTIKRADCIYVLENGIILEKGTYMQLVNQKGVFNSMIQFQGLEVVV